MGHVINKREMQRKDRDGKQYFSVTNFTMFLTSLIIIVKQLSVMGFATSVGYHFVAKDYLCVITETRHRLSISK